jgi:hypothetical protein
MAKGFQVAIDENSRTFEAVKPKTGYRLTGTETTTVRMAAAATSGLIRVVSIAAINYAITTSTTDSVTTSDAYLPAATIEYIRVDNAIDKFAFMGSSVVYITIMQ